MKLHTLSFLLLLIGGLNWLAFGLTGWDVGMLFGGMTATYSKAIYVLVGLAAVYELISHKDRCKHCMGMGKDK